MGESLAVALLAAGQSRRFGDADKLTAQFRGAMLGLHAARAIPADIFAHRWAIASSADHPCANGWQAAGFDLQPNPDAHQGMGTSVAMAARLAIDAEADALLIALADMPRVPAEHFRALTEGASRDAILVSQSGSARMPPALFGAAHFEHLARSSGDKGARELLREGTAIDCAPEWLRDIDTPEDL